MFLVFFLIYKSIKSFFTVSVHKENGLHILRLRTQGRPLYWVVEANAFWNKLGEVKKWKLGEIFFDGKLP